MESVGVPFHMLLTLDQYKAMAGLPAGVSSADTQLSALIAAADGVIKRYTNRDLESATYTQYLSGNNTQRLTLRHWPVTSITGLWLDNSGYFGQRLGSFDPTTSVLIEGTDFVLDRDNSNGSISRSGVLFRIGTVWPVVTRMSRMARLSPDQGPAFGNVKVVYTAGYSPIPDDLQLACSILTSLMKATIPLGAMINQEKIGTYSYSLLKNPSNKYRDDAIAVTSILSSYLDSPW